MAHYTELKLSQLSALPEIVPFVEASLALDTPEHYQELSDEMLLAIQASHPVQAVKVAGVRTKYQFFAGWQLLHELRRRRVEKVQVVVHKKYPPSIMDQAVMMELGALAMAAVNAQFQPYALQLLSEHSALWPKIFTGHRPQASATALQRLCNLTRATAQRVAAPKPRAVPQSALEKMLAREESESDPDANHA